MLFDKLALSRLQSVTEKSDEPIIDNTIIEDKEEKIKTDEIIPEETEETTEVSEVETTEEEEQEEEVEVDESEETYFSLEQLAEEEILWLDPEKEYALDGEGIKEAIRDTAKKQFDNFVNELPEDEKMFYDLIKSGASFKTVQEIANETDFKQVDPEVEDNQKLLITDHLTLMGYSKEQIEEKITELEDLGKLDREAKIAHKYLLKEQETSRAARVEADKKAQEQAKLQQETIIENLKTDISKTKEIAGFKVSTKENKDLVEAIFEKSKKGDVKADKVKIAYYELVDRDPELALKVAYMVHKDFKFDEVEKKAVTKATQTIKKVVSNFKDSNAISKSTPTVAPQKETLDLSKTWFGKNR
jgi:ribosomal protein L17